MSTYSGYDPSEFEQQPLDYRHQQLPPPNRSCFRALINGSSAVHAAVPPRSSVISYGGSSYVEEKSDRQSSSGYGLLDNQSAFPFEDSFFSSGTGKTTECTSSGGGGGSGNGGTGGRKRMKNKVGSAMCLKSIDRRRGGGGASERFSWASLGFNYM